MVSSHFHNHFIRSDVGSNDADADFDVVVGGIVALMKWPRLKFY